MSDDPVPDPKTTLPLHPPQPGGSGVPPKVIARATQMSPAPAPAPAPVLATLESLHDVRNAEKMERTAAPDEISGMLQEATERDDSALQAALRDASIEQVSARRSGSPQTLASPAAIGPIGIPQADNGPAPPPPPAVIDVGAPAHAFLPSAPPTLQGGRDALGSSPGLGSGPPLGMPGLGPGMSPAYGGGRVPQAHAAGPRQPARRPTNIPLLALIFGGAIVAVVVLAAGVGGFVFYKARRSADRGRHRDRDPSSLPGRASPGSGGVGPGTVESSALPPEEAPRNDPRSPMGGTKARLTGLVARSLDLNKARGAVAAAGPRFDACFAATELEPPNHETAGYDLDVSPTGEVTRAEPATQTGRCAPLDACMVQSLRATRMPRSPAGSPVKLTFAARIP